MLAIHCATGSFAVGWVEFCKERRVPFREVNCFDDNIIAQLRGCTMLIWHWEFHDYRAALFARQLIASVEAMGMLVFPNSKTGWHYDDKLGQKYLLEAVGAALVPSYVFYNRDSAIDFLGQARFPLVWKLRGGAGSQNVRLVRDMGEARRIVRRSFGRGWRPMRLHALRERIWYFRKAPSLRRFFDIGRGFVRAIFPHEKHRNQAVERNYVYFQEFIPNNDSDIRVVVIGARAFGMRRMVRQGDFRASGSGLLKFDRAAIPEDCIRLAFQTTEAISSQCCAFDMVRDASGWRIVEISYAFAPHAYRTCTGWWDQELNWHEGGVRAEAFMIEDLLASRAESAQPLVAGSDSRQAEIAGT